MAGTQFEFSYATSTTQQQIVAFEMAGELWSQYLKDDVTINIHVEVTDLLPENVIGGALPGMKKDAKYDKVYKELSQDITTWNDWYAIDSLLGSKEFSASIDGQFVDKLKSMKLTNANSKALDLIDGDTDKLDGYIVMSDLSGQNSVQWNYDASRSGAIADHQLDFLSVAVHEVGHILGFTSGLDDGEWLNTVTEAKEKGKQTKGDEMKFITPLDLFRYSSNGQHELSIGKESYFSIDGGRTNLADFSTGESSNFNGDGYQASHWKHDGNNVLGIMDPVLKLGVRRDISSLDTKAMDVTGWDVVNPQGLDWQEMYSDAVDGAEDAYLGDRQKDVEKMIKESNNYHGRRSRSSGKRGYHRQEGFWQNIRFQTLDSLDLTVEVPPTASNLSSTKVFTTDSDSLVRQVKAAKTEDLTSDPVDFDNQALVVTTTDAITLEIKSQTQIEVTDTVQDNWLENRFIPENISDWHILV